MSQRTLHLIVLPLVLASCGPADKGEPPRLTPVASPSSSAEPPPATPNESERDPGCGEEGLPCCEGECAGDTLACSATGVCESVASVWPEPAPAAACGNAGEACCATGDACPGSGGKAQCCTACTGAPDFKCACGETFQAGGGCKLCCVVCKDGFHKDSPLAVGASQSCQQAASDWCQNNRKVGAGDKSGWRSDCG